jgi:hypothetical protein
MAKQARSSLNGDPPSESLHEETSPKEHEAVFPPVSDVDQAEGESSDIGGKVATIAIVGVGVALISAELIPGMLIGVAAALLPGIGPKMRPFFRSTVRAGYKAVQKTREAMAEAGEQFQDIVAEAKAETKSETKSGVS